MKLSPGLISFFFVLLIAGFLSRCANPVMPIGGAKDTTPPTVLNSNPGNYSVNFSGRVITIEFDEFIKLDKINQQALISPPTETNPEFRLKGKSLQVRFEEDLRPETTYTIFFGNAIVDLTESNPLEGFNFVFSTGSVLDSMSLAGNVRFAFDEKAGEGIYALLYRDVLDTIPVDSLPFKRKPYYVARADKKGVFRFRNLRNEAYLMFALEDKNSNFLYDKGGEALAFTDLLVKPEFIADNRRMNKSEEDTLGHLMHDDHDLLEETDVKTKDSLMRVSDKIADSLDFMKLAKHDLSLFYEIDSTQRLMRSETVKKGLLRFAFRYPASLVEVEPLEILPDSFGLIRQYSRYADTLNWHFRDNVLDSLKITVKFDTLINDTLHLALTPRSGGVQKRSSKDVQKEGVLTFSSKAEGRKLDIGDKLLLNFTEPVIHYQMRDSNRFIANEDTLYNQLKFIKFDSIGLQYLLDVPDFEPEKSYSILFPDSVFFGLNGAVNDTIDLKFRVPAVSDYGNMFLEIVNENKESLIVQLLGQKENVLEERFVNATEKLVYNNMKPGKYRVKAIFDRNNNKRWDTGDWTKRIQPERVAYLLKELEIRPNWDLEEVWDINESKPESK